MHTFLEEMVKSLTFSYLLYYLNLLLIIKECLQKIYFITKIEIKQY